MIHMRGIRLPAIGRSMQRFRSMSSAATATTSLKNSTVGTSNTETSTIANKKKADIKLLSKLRKATSMPVVKCRDALLACDNVYDAAEEWLEKERMRLGLAKAEKMHERVSSEGVIGLLTDCSKSPKIAVLLEVNSETDFVARNEGFRSFVNSALKTAIQQRHTDLINIEDLKADADVSQKLSETIGTFGEKIELRRGVTAITGDKDILCPYIHSSDASSFGRIGSFVIISTDSSEESVLETIRGKGRRLAQHIAAMNPADVNELMEQEYCFANGDVPVKDELKLWESELGGATFNISRFSRIELGQGIEKAAGENYADEVARLAGTSK